MLNALLLAMSNDDYSHLLEVRPNNQSSSSENNGIIKKNDDGSSKKCSLVIIYNFDDT